MRGQENAGGVDCVVVPLGIMGAVFALNRKGGVSGK
jgi:hypothetical protein